MSMRILVLLLIALVVGCNQHRSTGGVSDPHPLGIARTRVRVVKATKEVRSSIRVFPGVLRPWQQAKLGARVAGDLRFIDVDRGDRVKKGQVVASVRIPGLGENVQRAVAQKKVAEAEVAILEDQQKRTAKVVQSGPAGLIADGEIAALDARLLAARARLSAAAADQGHGRSLLADATILAPFDGIVVARHADIGTALGAGAIVAEVADVSTLRLAIDVPERDAGTIRIGQRVNVTIAAMADHAVAATVARFAPVLDPATRTLRVEIDVPNREGKLLAGVTARAAIDTGLTGEVLTLPAEAIGQQHGETSVLVVEGDIARRKKIVIAHDQGQKVEIADGLKEGEDVILGGRGLIQDGTACEVAK